MAAFSRAQCASSLDHQQAGMTTRVMVVSWITRLVTNEVGESEEEVLFYIPLGVRKTAEYPHE